MSKMPDRDFLMATLSLTKLSRRYTDLCMAASECWKFDEILISPIFYYGLLILIVLVVTDATSRRVNTGILQVVPSPSWKVV